MRVATLQPQSPILKRENAFTFVSYLCVRCGANYRCVSGSRVGMNKSEYLLAVKRKTVLSDAMKLGAELHARYSSDMVEAKSLGQDLYYSLLRQGSEVTLKELKTCAMVGKRGTQDVLRISRVEGRRPEYFVHIQENKSHPGSREWYIKWMLQLALYGWVWTNYDLAYIHADDEHWWPAYLPEDLEREPLVNVRTTLHYLDSGRPDQVSWFARKSKVEEEWMHPWVALMLKKVREKWPLHRRGLYLVDVPDEPDPLFFGKKKLLVKSPPPLEPRSNFK